MRSMENFSGWFEFNLVEVDLGCFLGDGLWCCMSLEAPIEGGERLSNEDL